MEIILEERFGQCFSLKPQIDGRQLVLQLIGDERSITLNLNGSTFICSDSKLPCSVWNAADEGWPTALEFELPAPGMSAVPSPLIEVTAQGLHVNYDMLGMIYWILTRQEEIGRTDLDVHERFSASSSHAFKFAYLERPLVDEWLYVLGHIIKRQWPNIKLKKHNFTMRVSHDVDQPSLYAFKPWTTIARIMTGHILKRRDFRSFVTAPYVKFATSDRLIDADIYNTFDWLMDVSEANGLKSAFYFICGRTDPNKDADYEIGHPVIRDLLRRIHGRGHEIGLHPSYNTFRDPIAIKREFEKLRHICHDEHIVQEEWGGRMHYLRWEQPTTLEAWSNAGMNYDSTLGYADCPGFRCGTCFEYPAFNSITQQVLSLRIRPLVMMECSLIEDVYLGLGTGQGAIDKVRSLRRACERIGGCFTILWHNSQLSDESKKFMYLEALA